MILKTELFTLIAFIASSKGDNVWTGFTGKWSTNVSDGFYDLPQNLTAALDDGWTEISGVNPLWNATGLGYYGDPLFVLLFSQETNEAFGIQISMRVSDIDSVGVPINYTANSAYKTKTLDGEEYYSATAYFYKNEENGTRRIWLENQDGLLEIPTTSELVEEKLTSYEIDPCIERMGVHYYRIANVTDCSAVYPWILLMVQGNIIGIGILSVGHSTPAPERTWTEYLPDIRRAINTTVLGAPSCLADYAVAYGYTLHHIWFLDNPKDIVCDSTYVASV